MSAAQFDFPQAVIEAVAGQRNQALDTVAMQAATIAELHGQLAQAQAQIENLRAELSQDKPA